MQTVDFKHITDLVKSLKGVNHKEQAQEFGFSKDDWMNLRRGSTKAGQGLIQQIITKYNLEEHLTGEETDELKESNKYLKQLIEMLNEKKGETEKERDSLKDENKKLKNKEKSQDDEIKNLKQQIERLLKKGTNK